MKTHFLRNACLVLALSAVGVLGGTVRAAVPPVNVAGDANTTLGADADGGVIVGDNAPNNGSLTIGTGLTVRADPITNIAVDHEPAGATGHTVINNGAIDSQTSAVGAIGVFQNVTGVAGNHNGSVINTGTINADGGLAAGYAIVQNGPDDLTGTVVNSGTITGRAILADAVGIWRTASGVGDDRSITTNSGTIQAFSGNILATALKYEAGRDSFARIENSGTLSAVAGQADATGILVVAPVNDRTTIANSGTITATAGQAGGASGVWCNSFFNNYAQVTNSGTIAATTTGNDAYGIRMTAGLSEINQAIVINTGTISASSTGGDAYGVLFDGNVATGPNVLVNSGTILSTNIAVDMGAGDDQVFLQTGTRIVGDVSGGADSDTLALEGSGAADFRLLNFEKLQKNAAGTWSLMRDTIINNAAPDDVAVNGGTLAVNATLATSSGMVVNPGGTLGGTGRIIGSVTNNGHVAPGNSIGTITIFGNYTQTANASLDVEVSGAGPGDRLDVTGTANLAGTVNAIPVDLIRSDMRWTILTAGDGMNGAFASVTGSTPILQFSLEHYVDRVDLLVHRVPYAWLTHTVNERAVAVALSRSLPTATGDLADILMRIDAMPTGPAFRAALDSLHGIAFDPFIDLSFAASHRAFSGIAQRLQMRRMGADTMAFNLSTDASASPLLACAEDNPALLGALLANADSSEAGAPDRVWRFYTHGVGGFQHEEPGDRRVGFDANTGGFSTGFDRRIGDHWIGGLAVEYQRTDGDWGGERGDGDMHAVFASPYASFFTDHWFVETALSYGRCLYEGRRKIAFLDRTARADFDGDEYSAYVGGGHAFDLGVLTVEPLASVQYAYLSQEDCQERAAASANLRTDDRRTDSFQTSAGVRLSRKFPLEWGYLVPELRARWLHECLDDHREMRCRLEGSPSQPFTVRTWGPDADSALVGLGLTASIRGRMAAYAQYDAQADGTSTTHAVTAGFSIDF